MGGVDNQQDGGWAEWFRGFGGWISEGRFVKESVDTLSPNTRTVKSNVEGCSLFKV